MSPKTYSSDWTEEESREVSRRALITRVVGFWRRHHQSPTAGDLGVSSELWTECSKRIALAVSRVQRGTVLSAIIDHIWEHDRMPSLAEASIRAGFLVSQEVFDTCGYQTPLDVIRRYRAIGGYKTEIRAQEFNRRITGSVSMGESGSLSWEEAWCDKLGIPFEPGTPRALRRLKALERGFAMLERPRLFGQTAETITVLRSAVSILSSREEQRRHLRLVLKHEEERKKARVSERQKLRRLGTPLPRETRNRPGAQLVFEGWSWGLGVRPLKWHERPDEAEESVPAPSDVTQAVLFPDLLPETKRRAAAGA